MDREESSRIRRASNDNIALRSAIRQARRGFPVPGDGSNGELLINGIPLSEMRANPHLYRRLPVTKPNTDGDGRVA